MLLEASALESKLDADGWDHDLEVDELLERQEQIEGLYRQGFAKAQQVSAQFFERQALLYGWQTEVARQAFGFQRIAGRDIEDLYPEQIDHSEGWSL